MNYWDGGDGSPRIVSTTDQRPLKVLLPAVMKAGREGRLRAATSAPSAAVSTSADQCPPRAEEIKAVLVRTVWTFQRFL